MKLFLLISSLAVVYSRPQYYHSEGSSTVEYGALEERTQKVVIIPFYGGGKGQSLQIVENSDGTVTTTIIRTPLSKPIPTPTDEDIINAAELENPPLPSKQDQDYGTNIRNIHKTALNIIKLQEIAKQKGTLTASEESVYKQNMESLNRSAQNLAHIQEESIDFENREGLSPWFERKKSNKKDKDKKKQEEEKKKKEEEEKKKREEEKRREEEEEKKKEEEEEEERRKKEEEKKEKPKEEEEEEEVVENEDDAITINLPPEDASVAEAKPVGLAVAGEGGVAASKPIATAVVGPGGLAIARPVGTAIAGVSPDQALVPIYAEGYIAGIKPKRYGSSQKQDAASEYLNRIISKYHQN